MEYRDLKTQEETRQLWDEEQNCRTEKHFEEHVTDLDKLEAE